MLEKLHIQVVVCENRDWDKKERNTLMAKAKMLCPFSGIVCKDCPVYRGRHYFLCFCEKYRGCLPEAIKDLPMSKKGPNGKFEMPSLPTSKEDPYINKML